MVALRCDLADYTASTGMCWVLLRYLQRQGVGLGSLRTGPMLELERLIAPAARVSLLELHRLWEWAGTIMPADQPLGLKVAGTIDPSAATSWPMPFALLEAIGRFSPTLLGGLERQLPFTRLLCDGLSVKLERWTHGSLLVSWEYAFPQLVPHDLVDFHLAGALVLLRRLLGQRAAVPVETWFPRSKPDKVVSYGTFFGPSLRFGAARPALVVRAAAFETFLPSHDPGILWFLEHQGRTLLGRLPFLPDILSSIREQIEAELPNGRPTQRAIAARINLSPRTLHRRLRSQETTFQRQLDCVRYRLATKYLTAEYYDLNQIASLLGFVDQSAFRRAFKAWAGQTVTQYRSSLHVR